MTDRYTFGVEEEYQLVSPESGELVSRASVVLRGDRSGAVEGEAQETMLEIGTPVSRSAEELAVALRERRFQASAAAAAEDLEIVAAGAHPYSEWQQHSASAASRPRMLMGLFRQVMRQEHIFGMHVHVAIPEDVDRLKLMNRLRGYAPHLIALAASSPFMLGEDTGFSSMRTISWRRFPFTGVPPRFESEDEYDAYIDVLLRGGAIPDARTVYWSIRPSPRYPTLELRMCDVCPSISDAVAIAVLSRAMVVAAVHDELPAIGSSLQPSLQDEILSENQWIAARDGLHATIIAPESDDGRLSIRDAVESLLEITRPYAKELGDTEALGGVDAILEKGSAADRMRAVFAEGGSLQAVVDWAVRETRVGTGIDRRSESRAEVSITALKEE